jgi:hypothetical protein
MSSISGNMNNASQRLRRIHTPSFSLIDKLQYVGVNSILRRLLFLCQTFDIVKPCAPQLPHGSDEEAYIGKVYGSCARP